MAGRDIPVNPTGPAQSSAMRKYNAIDDAAAIAQIGDARTSSKASASNASATARFWGVIIARLIAQG
jgi:hypothetical protein